MADLPRPLRVSAQALRTMMSHAGVVLAVCLGITALRTPIDHLLYANIVGVGNSLAGDQSTMIKYILADAGVLLLAEVLLGPIMAAVAVYLARRDQVGKTSNLSGSLGFAIRRYKRMFVPHLAAQISIQVGLQLLLVPGLLFYGMYAFVEPVAALEDGEWALDRSKVLTRGRRGTIMWLVIPIVVVLFVKTYAVDLQALGNIWALFATDMVNLLLEFFLYTAFAWLYLERVTSKTQEAPPDSPASAEPA
jgi:hypothetical protein